VEALSAEPASVRKDALTVAILSDAQAERMNRAGIREGVGFATFEVGFAPMDADAGGREAYVFYDRVQLLWRKWTQASAGTGDRDRA
jgi:hypothetical protein